MAKGNVKGGVKFVAVIEHVPKMVMKISACSRLPDKLNLTATHRNFIGSQIYVKA